MCPHFLHLLRVILSNSRTAFADACGSVFLRFPLLLWKIENAHIRFLKPVGLLGLRLSICKSIFGNTLHDLSCFQVDFICDIMIQEGPRCFSQRAMSLEDLTVLVLLYLLDADISFGFYPFSIYVYNSIVTRDLFCVTGPSFPGFRNNYPADFSRENKRK